MPDPVAGVSAADARVLRLFTWLAPALYLLFALVTPPFQTPDEQQHLFRAWQLSTFQLIGERQGEISGGYLPAGVVHAAAIELGSTKPHDKKVFQPTGWGERFARATPIGANEPLVFTNFVGSVSYSPVGYVPQIMAVWAGRALDLPVEWIVRLGRVLNAGLTFVLLLFALRALPLGRQVLMLIALLPMTAACAGSFGQDGLVIGASAWLVALCLRAVLSGAWQREDVVPAVLLTLVVTLAKFVYLPLAGLALLLTKKGGRLRIGWPSLIAIALAAAGLLLWVMPNGDLVVRSKPQLAVPSQQLAYMVHHPWAFPQAFASTFDPHGLYLVLRSLGWFAWFNVGPVMSSLFLTLPALALVMWMGDRRARDLLPLWRVWSLVICAGVFVVIALSMYLAATPLGARHIYGVQGRYLLPFLLPLLLCFMPPRKKPPAAWLVNVVAGTLVLANVTALGAIAQAFYR
ncbi:DUF2142 domain-containing protein [Novosphingobium aquae]|uniref:DUF2142 domain-containing protein n=1 Tax=Novosphingobium aquae TaxID=3133435 RepID=A0ABU8S961_9SPHN